METLTKLFFFQSSEVSKGETTFSLNSSTILMSRSIGVVYLWFGFLKFFSGISPAEELAINTIDQLVFGLISPDVTIILLAIWEVAVGLMLIFGLLWSLALRASLIHMIFTFTPLIFFPDIAFGQNPLTLTLLGQYILKNLVIISVLVHLIREQKAVYE